MKVIPGYRNEAHLKKMIITQYITSIIDEQKTLNSILKDENWASTKSDYHKQCRKDMTERVNEATKQIKMLSHVDLNVHPRTQKTIFNTK